MNKWFVTHTEAKQKLITFLSIRLPRHFSQRALKRGLEHNLCRINGRVERYASYQLKKGDQVAFWTEEMSGPPQHSLPRVVWEDHAYLAIDKPNNWVSSSEMLASDFKGCILIHRLDRTTTGLLLAAKSLLAAEKMTALFKKRSVVKMYLALVDGVPREKKGQIDWDLGDYIQKGDQKFWRAVPKGDGLSARTDWQCVKTGPLAALLRCFPYSGRMHQIRVHLKAIGHPIIGDAHYQRIFNCPYPAKRPLLHAAELSFTHPFSGEQINLAAPVHLDMQRAIEALVG